MFSFCLCMTAGSTWRVFVWSPWSYLPFWGRIRNHLGAIWPTVKCMQICLCSSKSTFTYFIKCVRNIIESNGGTYIQGNIYIFLWLSESYFPPGAMLQSKLFCCQTSFLNGLTCFSDHASRVRLPSVAITESWRLCKIYQNPHFIKRIHPFAHTTTSQWQKAC